MPTAVDSPETLFVKDLPLIDVRAPVEFGKGAFPAARNLPILNDGEREQVGICYKQSGADAAYRLGLRLVSGATRAQRIRQWAEFISAHENALLYCFRGGQRSRIACDWLKAEGIETPRIAGGYKRLRGYLLAVFERLPPIVLVSGKTGSGKTDFVTSFDASIDLEAIANHRGSAFGGRISPQPGQVNFENRLAIAFVKAGRHPALLLEDEGRLIGRLQIPPPLQARMKAAPLLVLDEPLERRAGRIFDEYIEAQWQEYLGHFGATAAMRFRRYLLDAMDAIRKRLGNAAHADIRAMLTDAISEHDRTGSLNGHRRWITRLLSDYYDPMYAYQLARKAGRICITGPREVVAGWYAENRGRIL